MVEAIIGHERLKDVGESQLCMVSNGRSIPHASYLRIGLAGGVERVDEDGDLLDGDRLLRAIPLVYRNALHRIKHRQPPHHPPEHRVLAVEMGALGVGQEELRAVGARACIPSFRNHA